MRAGGPPARGAVMALARKSGSAEPMREHTAEETTPETREPIVLRAVRPGDLPYLRDSWLRSNAGSAQARDERPYYRLHKARINRILSVPGVVVRVACSAADADAIVGWAVVTPEPVLHYVYVRREAQRLGVARRLLAGLESMPVHYTHKPANRGHTPIPDGWMYRSYLDSGWSWNMEAGHG